MTQTSLMPQRLDLRTVPRSALKELQQKWHQHQRIYEFAQQLSPCPEYQIRHEVLSSLIDDLAELAGPD